MGEDIEKQVIKYIPEQDKERARDLCNRAIKLGYFALGVWESWSEQENGYLPNPPTYDDIVGVNPNSRCVEFLAGL